MAYNTKLASSDKTWMKTQKSHIESRRAQKNRYLLLRPLRHSTLNYMRGCVQSGAVHFAPMTFNTSIQLWFYIIMRDLEYKSRVSLFLGKPFIRKILHKDLKRNLRVIRIKIIATRTSNFHLPISHTLFEITH